MLETPAVAGRHGDGGVQIEPIEVRVERIASGSDRRGGRAAPPRDPPAGARRGGNAAEHRCTCAGSPPAR